MKKKKIGVTASDWAKQTAIKFLFLTPHPHPHPHPGQARSLQSTSATSKPVLLSFFLNKENSTKSTNASDGRVSTDI